jgi:Kef-type K+ transport system membrane component KefB/nucleotide-binding universal stress UspA family protein
VTLPLTEPAYVFAALFLAVLFAPLLAERARAPGLIGLVLAGALIGPNGLGILERAGAVEALGGVGLLYLMFLAGIDLDLEGFNERRRESLLFGVSTTVIPMLLVTAVSLGLGMGLLAALLIASAFTSHTLVAYPLVQRLGLVKTPAVTATIGATLVCVVAALLVLAVVASAHQGSLGPLFWLQLAASLSAFLALVLWGLPWLTRRFFAGVGQDRNVRFTYVLVALFATATIADLAGIEAIVGAFLAGLALNRFVAPGGVLMTRVQFLGSSLLIPLFLISTGMLILPSVVTDLRVLGMGAAWTLTAIAAKWLAAWPVARHFGFSRPEVGVMTALSSGQAAGALAAAIVASNIGLIDQDAVNAVVLVILGSCLFAAVAAERYAPLVQLPARRHKRVGETVVVPIANPASAGPLVKLASLVAGRDSGTVLPLNVLGFEAPQEVVEEHRSLAQEAERTALRNGADARGLVRIDSSPTAGVLHTVVEEGGTCLLMGWKGYTNAREAFFGGVIDAILSRSPVPVLVCRPGSDDRVRRIVLSVTRGDLSPGGLSGLDLGVAIADRMARQADVGLLVVTEEEDRRLEELLADARKVEVVHDARKPAIALRGATDAGDVVLLGTPPTRAGLGQNATRVARALPGRTVVAVVPRLLG